MYFFPNLNLQINVYLFQYISEINIKHPCLS